MPSTVLFLAKSPLVEQYDLSSLKDVTSGAAPLGEELSKTLKERLPSIEWFRQGRPRKFRSNCSTVLAWITPVSLAQRDGLGVLDRPLEERP